MKASLRKWIVQLIGLSLIIAAVAFEWLFNRPGLFVKYEPTPLIVMDDFHEQVSLVFLQMYGPSRYRSGFTEFSFHWHTLCALPFSGVTVLFFLLGAAILVVGAVGKYLHHETSSANHIGGGFCKRT